MLLVPCVTTVKGRVESGAENVAVWIIPLQFQARHAVRKRARFCRFKLDEALRTLHDICSACCATLYFVAASR